MRGVGLILKLQQGPVWFLKEDGKKQGLWRHICTWRYLTYTHTALSSQVCTEHERVRVLTKRHELERSQPPPGGPQCH